MKRFAFLTLSVLAVLLAWQSAFSLVPYWPNGNGGGRYFTKTITYNISSYNENGKPVYNLSSKGMFDKIFFGFTNSPVEYKALSGYLFGTDCGLRLYRDEIDSLWRLEIIPDYDYLTEWEAIYNDIKMADAPFQFSNWWNPESAEADSTDIWKNIPQEFIEKFNEQITQARKAKRDEVTYTSRRPKTKIVPVGRLGDLFYENFVSIIANYKSEGLPAMVMDGDSITFRCVVGNELWELSIEEPYGLAGRMSYLCRRIIKEVSETSSLDEEKYIAELESMNP